MTSITLEDVSRHYSPQTPAGKRITAVDNVTLRVPEGDSLALLGPSGCGKTTLLRLMAGLEAPDSGRVLYDGVPVTEIPKESRGIGMVFQDYALIPHWEAGRSVGFFLRLRHREAEVPQRVRQVSQITGVGIEALMGRFPRELSGGEKQRVAIARAFARDLNILLFDEPFANLDTQFRAGARLELRRLLDEFMVTSVFVTHEQQEASALSKRIAIMRDGRIEQAGTYEQLYYSPINLFVAGFLGSPGMNLFHGYKQGEHWRGENFGGYPIRRDLPDDTPVTLGIRPENVHLDAQGIPAVVDSISPHFSERYKMLEVWLGDERWQMIVPLEQPVHIGETVYCALDEDHIYYFDTFTGDRIG